MAQSQAASAAPMTTMHDLVFLFDVDNTLLDNDRVQATLKPVDIMSGHIRTCSSVRPTGTALRLAMASGTHTNSAWQPSMVLPNFQPPIAFQPCLVPAPSCEP